MNAEIPEISEARKIDAINRSQGHRDLYDFVNITPLFDALFNKHPYEFVAYPNTVLPWPFENRLENLGGIQRLAYVMGWSAEKTWDTLVELEEAGAIGMFHVGTRPDGGMVMVYRVL